MVVSGVDAPPIFEPPEHVFDFVALLVEVPIRFRRDADGDAALCEGGAEPIRVVALVGESSLALGRAGNISAAPL